MTKAFIVSYTDKETQKKVVHLHIGYEPHFIKDGLQMVTETFDVDNVYLKI